MLFKIALALLISHAYAQNCGYPNNTDSNIHFWNSDPTCWFIYVLLN